MSVKLMSAVFEAGGLSSPEKVVLLALADHGNDEGYSIWPSVERLAAMTGLTDRGVQKILKRLVGKRLLLPVQSSRPTNEYRLDPEQLRQMRHSHFNRGVNAVHLGGERGSPIGVNAVHHEGERGSYEPSLNHQNEPSKEPRPEDWFEQRRVAQTGPSAPHTAEEYKRRIESALQRGVGVEISLREDIQRCFHLNPNWTNKTWSALLLFLKERLIAGETVETFAVWWSSDWRGKDGSPPSAGQIRELWPQAFRAAPEPTGIQLRLNEDGSLN